MAQTLFERGQRNPVISAGTLGTPDMGFITIEDLIRALLPQQVSGGGTPIPTGTAFGPMAAPPQLLSAQVTPQAAPKPAPVAPTSEEIPWDAFLRTGLAGINELGKQVTGGVQSMVPQAQPTTNPLETYLQTWTNGQPDLHWPLHRGPEQTGAQNTAAGLANATLNLPQNLMDIYQQFIGQPFTGAVKPVLQDMWKFFTVPEGQVDAEEAGTAATPPSFTPGLPGPQGSTVDQIMQVESGGRSNARNPKSSAYGPGQFIRSTWLDFMREVHPDELDVIGEKAALELRSDPQWAQEATSWYAGKAVDVLDSIDAPATDANIYLHHFLGPEGVRKLLSADPSTVAAEVLGKEQVAANSSILGGGRTVQDVINWATAKMGEGEAQPPVTRPDVILPDFSAANAFFDAARPQPVSEEDQRQLMFNIMLSGIGAGLDGPLTSGADLFGNLAGATSGAAAGGQHRLIELQQDFQKQMSDYNMARGGIAQDQEETLTVGRNAQATTQYQNAADQRDFTEQQRAAAKAAKVPKVIQSSADGIWIQTPEGEVQHISASQNDQFEQLEQVGKALGQDSQTARMLKYNLLSQTPGTNLLSMEMEIMRDLVRDGMAPAILGEQYADVLADAEGQVPAALAGDAKAYQAQLEKAITANMMGVLAGDTTWILQAAQMGNPGAMLLVQGGDFGE